MRALVSVWEKSGVDEFARGLVELGFEIVSSGGTASFLENREVPVTRVEEVTAAPELLGGRVKTLHPRIHAGILARRDLAEDRDALAKHEIDPFDLVCVNLYPFASVAGRRGATEAEAVEMIDIGGPTLLRAAAKNFAHVVAVSREEQYADVLASLRAEGRVPLEERRALAAQAFAATAAYEAAIANWFGETEPFPAHLTLAFHKVVDLPYGENPHQHAAYYREDGARRHLLSRVEQLGGRELSYNNLGDLEAARRVAREFALPTAVIVKHGNPCGTAVAGTIDDAYERALSTDPVSSFGCVLVLNRPVPAALGRRIAEQFVEVVLAPDYEPEALAALGTKPAVRILRDRERRAETPGERDLRRVLGGLLVQERDSDVEDREHMTVACGQVSEARVGRPPVRVACLQARRFECDRDRTRPPDDRGRRRPDEPRRRGQDRARPRARARPRHDRCGHRVGRVLPVRRRAAARARSGHPSGHPTGRLQARRRGARGRPGRRRRHGAHGPSALPPLEAPTRRAAPAAPSGRRTGRARRR